MILILVAAAVSPARAGGIDPRSPRDVPRDIAKARAQEAQKQKLLAKMQADAPSRTERLPTVNPLQLPLFAERRAP